MEFEAKGQASGVAGSTDVSSGQATRMESLLVEGRILSVLLLLAQKLSPESLLPERLSSICVPGPQIPRGRAAAQMTSAVGSLSTRKEPSTNPLGAGPAGPPPPSRTSS